jgi:CRISPR system Cascade subunit CasE
MRALVEPQLLHGAVERSFTGDRQRRLWRIDRLNDQCYMLILSHERVNFSHITEQFGNPTAQPLWETKDYKPFLNRIQTGQTWRFRLCANPVQSVSSKAQDVQERGKIYAHVTQDQQKKWLACRAARNGFSLIDENFDTVHTQWLKFNKGGNFNAKVTLRTATFEGLLTVTDVELFKQALISGIGRAKAYGCGLLTIARSLTGVNNNA